MNVFVHLSEWPKWEPVHVITPIFNFHINAYTKVAYKGLLIWIFPFIYSVLCIIWKIKHYSLALLHNNWRQQVQWKERYTWVHNRSGWLIHLLYEILKYNFCYNKYMITHFYCWTRLINILQAPQPNVWEENSSDSPQWNRDGIQSWEWKQSYPFGSLHMLKK